MTTDVAYPEVYAALLVVAQTALPDSDTVRVVDGYDVSDDPGDVVMLGVPNLTDTASIAEGTFSQEQSGYGVTGVVSETGSINGIAMAWTGDAGDQAAPSARVAAASYIAAISAAIRADRHLGITAYDINAQLTNVDVASDKVDGATCALSFTVNYHALLQAQ